MIPISFWCGQANKKNWFPKYYFYQLFMGIGRSSQHCLPIHSINSTMNYDAKNPWNFYHDCDCTFELNKKSSVLCLFLFWCQLGIFLIYFKLETITFQQSGCFIWPRVCTCQFLPWHRVNFLIDHLLTFSLGAWSRERSATKIHEFMTSRQSLRQPLWGMHQ